MVILNLDGLVCVPGDRLLSDELSRRAHRLPDEVDLLKYAGMFQEL